MQLPKISLFLTSLVFGVFGIIFFVSPEFIMHAGLEITSLSGKVEIRGFYGGFEIGLAIFFAMAVFRPEWHLPALAVQCFSFGGMAIGRILGILISGGSDGLLFALIIAECTGLIIGLLAIRSKLKKD